MSKRGSAAAEQVAEQKRPEGSRAVKSQKIDTAGGARKSGTGRIDPAVDISSEGRKKLVMGRLISRIVSADTVSRTCKGKRRSSGE